MITPSNTPALILAGGRGVTENGKPIPKVMLHIAARNFLQWQVENLRKTGFHRIFIAATHEIHLEIANLASELRLYPVKEDKRLMTGGAVLACQEHWGDRVFIIHGDTWLPENWADMLAFHEEKHALATWALVDQGWTLRYGESTQENGMLTEVCNRRPGSGPGLSNGGAYILEKNAFSTFKPGDAFCIERELFPFMIGRVAAYVCKEKAIRDIGVYESRLALESLLA